MTAYDAIVFSYAIIVLQIYHYKFTPSPVNMDEVISPLDGFCYGVIVRNHGIGLLGGPLYINSIYST